MARRGGSVLRDLATLPWWASIVLAAAVYFGLRFLLPVISADDRVTQSFVKAAAKVAPFFALLILLPVPFSLLNAAKRRRLLDTQLSLSTIRSLHWSEFELMVGEAFRRQGYSIEERGGAAPDGGIDLVLRKGGKKTIVQCKQWRIEKVGVNIVRELLGVVVAERANKGILVCSGTFTFSATQFARRNAIELIGGQALENLVFPAVGRAERRLEPEFAKSPETSALCPKCGNDMVRRVGKRGAYLGITFLGCSRYPDCKGMRSL